MQKAEVKSILTRVWPALTETWFFDNNYYLPKYEELAKLVAVSEVRKERPTGEGFDYDDFALQLHAEIKRNRHNPPWAFGEAFGNRFKGWPKLHMLNICVCPEGPVLIEPQTGEIWTPNPSTDNVLFVRV